MRLLLIPLLILTVSAGVRSPRDVASQGAPAMLAKPATVQGMVALQEVAKATVIAPPSPAGGSTAFRPASVDPQTNRVAAVAVIAPGGPKTNVLSLSITIPPNGSTTTNHYFWQVSASKDLTNWVPITTFEELSGTTNTLNLTATNSKAFARMRRL